MDDYIIPEVKEKIELKEKEEDDDFDNEADGF